MSDFNSANRRTKTGRRPVPMRDNSPELLAKSMIGMFGSATAGQAIDMVRLQTRAENRDAAIKWQQIMRLIEEARRETRS